MRRGFPITKTMRAERRARAEAQNKEYNEKYPTLQAKLDALPTPGANKQRAKLTAKLAEANTRKVATATAEAAKQAKAKEKKAKE